MPRACTEVRRSRGAGAGPGALRRNRPWVLGVLDGWCGAGGKEGPEPIPAFGAPGVVVSGPIQANVGAYRDFPSIPTDGKAGYAVWGNADISTPQLSILAIEHKGP